VHKCTHRACNDACISFVNAAYCQSQSFYFAALWHSLIWQENLLSAHAANCPVSVHFLQVCTKAVVQDTAYSHAVPQSGALRLSAIAGLQSVSGSRAVAAHCRVSGKPGCTSSHLMQLKRYYFICSCLLRNFAVLAALNDPLSASWN